jgi:hypothetical protein
LIVRSPLRFAYGRLFQATARFWHRPEQQLPGGEAGACKGVAAPSAEAYKGVAAACPETCKGVAAASAEAFEAVSPESGQGGQAFSHRCRSKAPEEILPGHGSGGEGEEEELQGELPG